jgi:hypothetical protein
VHGEWLKGLDSALAVSLARSERAVVGEFQPVAQASDRRRHSRHDLIGHCWIDSPWLTLLGPTHDIGVGGLFVRTAAKLELGTPVEVCLRVPGESESLLAQALVARSVPIGFGPPCHGLGLAFVEIAHGQSLLRSLVNRSLPPLG